MELGNTAEVVVASGQMLIGTVDGIAYDGGHEVYLIAGEWRKQIDCTAIADVPLRA